MKKKIIAILCVLVMLFALVSCGGSNTANTNTNTNTGNDAPQEVTWPNGKLTIYVPAEAGSPVDQMARCWADAYVEATKGDFEVVNDAAGDGERLFQLLKKAKPDGMTILIGGAGQIMQYYSGVHQDNPADLTKYTIVGPCMWQAKMAAACLTQPDAPYNNVQELKEYVKAHPGQVTCAMSSGTSRYLAMTRLLEALDIYNDVRIVEANSKETTTGLLGGTINIALMNDQYVPQYVSENTLKALVLTRVDREYETYIDEQYWELMSKIPTFGDLGLNDYYTVSPMCIFGPAGMSADLCNKMIQTMETVLTKPEWTERIKTQLGGSNCYDSHTHEELEKIILDADKVIADILGKK